MPRVVLAKTDAKQGDKYHQYKGLLSRGILNRGESLHEFRAFVKEVNTYKSIHYKIGWYKSRRSKGVSQ